MMWAMLAQSKGWGWLRTLGNDYLVEEKIKGVRCKAEVEKHRVRLIGRSGGDLTASFPEIVEALEMIRRDAVLDGEIAFKGDGGKWDESLMIARSNGSASMNRIVGRTMPATFHVFDMPQEKGIVVERKAKALGIWYDCSCEGTSSVGRWKVLDHVDGRMGLQFFNQVVERGGEGVMVKRVNSEYKAGRGWDWVKVKPWKTDLLWAVALTEGKIGGYGAIVLVDMQGKYVGKAGGLTKDVIRVLEGDWWTFKEAYKAASSGMFAAVNVPKEVCAEVKRWIKKEKSRGERGTSSLGVPVVIRYLDISEKGLLQSAEFGGYWDGNKEGK